MYRIASLKLTIYLWILLAASSLARAADVNGHWQLEIEGRQHFIFGDTVLHGGLVVPWRASIDFYIKENIYQNGAGKSEWIDSVTLLSRPEGWITCELLKGTYLDRNLNMRETPWVRYPGFPVAGRLVDGVVDLSPAFTLPGNYLALTYACASDNELAYNWFVFARRAKQENGLRQDFELSELGDKRSARVSEVQEISPPMQLSFPLEDGWYFSRGSDSAGFQVTYRLRKVTN